VKILRRARTGWQRSVAILSTTTSNRTYPKTRCQSHHSAYSSTIPDPCPTGDPGRATAVRPTQPAAFPLQRGGGCRLQYTCSRPMSRPPYARSSRTQCAGASSDAPSPSPTPHDLSCYPVMIGLLLLLVIQRRRRCRQLASYDSERLERTESRRVLASQERVL